MRTVLCLIVLLSLLHTQSLNGVENNYDESKPSRSGIPQWVLKGILYTESASRYRADGSIEYVNRADGRDGEIGCFQITPAAFKQVKYSGEVFSRMRTDTAFSEEIAIRYLTWLSRNYPDGGWYRTVQRYNSGPRGNALDYAERVITNYHSVRR